jgi:hypothetical protein
MTRPQNSSRRNLFRKIRQLDLPQSQRRYCGSCTSRPPIWSAGSCCSCMPFASSPPTLPSASASTCAWGPCPSSASWATLGLTFGVLYGVFRQLEADVQRQFAVLVASPA